MMIEDLYRKLGAVTKESDTAVSFDRIASCLPVIFRTIGGRKFVKFIAHTATPHNQTYGFLRYLSPPAGMANNLTANTELIALPEKIDIFDSARLNRDLYIWLAFFFASSEPHQMNEPEDPLLKDMNFIRHSYHTALRTLTYYKEFVERYQQITKAILITREDHSTSVIEKDVEGLIRSLLGDEDSKIKTGHPFFDYVVHGIPLPSTLHASPDYKPAQSLPLWGELHSSLPASLMLSSSSHMDNNEKNIEKPRSSAVDQTLGGSYHPPCW